MSTTLQVPLTPEQARGSPEQQQISKMLNNIDEWNLRVFAVELKLMYHHPTKTSNPNWLDDAAKAIIDVFQVSANYTFSILFLLAFLSSQDRNGTTFKFVYQ